MSSSTSTSVNPYAALHLLRSASATLQNISFYQSQYSPSSSLPTENSMSINISTDAEGVKFLCQLLDEMIAQGGSLKNLTNLSFHGIKWEQRQLRSLCSLLDKNSSIKQIEFQGNTIERQGMEELSQMLERNEGIKAIIFSECNIGSTGARLLSSALTRNEILEELQIWEDSIGSQGAEELATMIEVNPTLKLLIVFDKESITATPLISAILARSNRAGIRGKRRVERKERD